MKRLFIISLVGLVTVLLLSLFSTSSTLRAEKNEKKAEKTEKKQHKFIGARKCARCHRKKEEGEQYQIWKKGPHARAYKVLKTKEAREIGKKMGISAPHRSGKCLKCHVTGLELFVKNRKKYFGRHFKITNGVSCENCHGAGEDYGKENIMKDREKSIELGMTRLKPEDCARCHNKESPTYKGPYNFKKMWHEKIKHYKPGNKPSEAWKLDDDKKDDKK